MGARRAPSANSIQTSVSSSFLLSLILALNQNGLGSHIRGRCAWRVLGTSGSFAYFAAYCRGVVAKARQPREVVEAEARERPEPSRIKERAEAIVTVQLRQETSRGEGV